MSYQIYIYSRLRSVWIFLIKLILPLQMKENKTNKQTKKQNEREKRERKLSMFAFSGEKQNPCVFSLTFLLKLTSVICMYHYLMQNMENLVTWRLATTLHFYTDNGIFLHKLSVGSWMKKQSGWYFLCNIKWRSKQRKSYVVKTELKLF